MEGEDKREIKSKNPYCIFVVVVVVNLTKGKRQNYTITQDMKEDKEKVKEEKHVSCIQKSTYKMLLL